MQAVCDNRQPGSFLWRDASVLTQHSAEHPDRVHVQGHSSTGVGRPGKVKQHCVFPVKYIMPFRSYIVGKNQ